jgi:3-methyladenine DNA glycosylase AlkD
MLEVVQKIRQELKVNSNPAVRDSNLRYFKEEIHCYGLKAAAVKSIAKKYWVEIKKLGKHQVFEISRDLLRSGMLEETGIVTLWIPKLKRKFEQNDLVIFRDWIEKYINNWANCDSFCNHTIGDYLEKYPHKVTELKSWAMSKNRWMKRAAAVSLIVPARRGEFLEDIFEIADIMLEDKDDMVQKGYGWMLKEASRKHRDEVFDYVIKNKKKMPRTALRYAIELMPDDIRSEAMKKS